LAEEFARWAVEHGGTVSGEHGLGKLKRNLLKTTNIEGNTVLPLR